MCPLGGVTATVGNGAVIQQQQQKVVGVSGGASGTRGLSTASGDKGVQPGVITGVRSEPVDSNPQTASLLASQHAILDQPVAVPPKAGVRARRDTVVSECTDFSSYSAQVKAPIDALYASTLAALESSQAQLVPAFEALIGALNALSVPTVDQDPTAFNATLVNATSRFVDSVDTMIGLYQPGQPGAFNPLSTVFDSFLLNMSNPASLSAKGVSAEASMTQSVNTWIAAQKVAFPGNDAAYDQLASVILQGRVGTPGVDGSFQSFSSGLSEKMTDTERFFSLLVSPTSQLSAVPQIKLQIAAARGGQSNIDLSAMMALLNAWNSGRQAVVAAKPGALGSARALSAVVPGLVSAAGKEADAIRLVSGLIVADGVDLCADISGQQNTCSASKTQVTDFDNEMADLSAQEDFWDKAGQATLALAVILGVFTAMDMLSKFYDYIQETRGISKSTDHDPSARDIVRNKFELFARSRWGLNRGWDRAKEYVSSSAISERWLSASRRVVEDTPRTNLRIIYDYLRSCIVRNEGD